MFPPDFKELLSDLNSQNSKYLVIGGYAVGVHAQPRATKDLDILISPDPENAKAVYDALAKFGAPLQGITPEDLIEKDTFFRMGSPPLMVDILPNIKGVEFESAWQRRVDVEVEPGLKVPVISGNDLIRAKLAAGRGQDLLDVAAIREANKTKEQEAIAADLPNREQEQSKPKDRADERDR